MSTAEIISDVLQVLPWFGILAMAIWRRRTEGLQTCAAHEKCRKELDDRFNDLVRSLGAKIEIVINQKADARGLDRAFQKIENLDKEVADMGRDAAMYMGKLEAINDTVDRLEVMFSNYVQGNNTPLPTRPHREQTGRFRIPESDEPVTEEGPKPENGDKR